MVLGLVALVVVVAAVTGIAVRARGGGRANAAAPALGPLPSGYRYVRMEPDQATATSELYRDRYEATDVEVTLIEAPQGVAPVGVTMIAFVLPAVPDLLALASRLEQDVPLVDPKPKVLAGEPVLSHDGDATLSSATLFAHGRLAIVTYGSTTAEVDGVMEAVLGSGGWRRSPAA